MHEEQGRHTLAVQAVALDLSTPLHYRGGGENGSGGDAPGGILYSGGRDGLLMSVDLGLPTRRRRFKYGRTWDDGRDSDSDDSEPEYDFDRTPQAGFRDDQLDYWGVGARASTSSKRKSGGRPRKSSSASTSASVRRSGADGPLSAEELWEVDDDRVGTSVPRDTFRQSVQAHTDVRVPSRWLLRNSSRFRSLTTCRVTVDQRHCTLQQQPDACALCCVFGGDGWLTLASQSFPPLPTHPFAPSTHTRLTKQSGKPPL